MIDAAELPVDPTSVTLEAHSGRVRPSIEHRVVVPRFLWTAMLQEFSTRNARRHISLDRCDGVAAKALPGDVPAHLRAVNYDLGANRVDLDVRLDSTGETVRATVARCPRRIEIVRSDDGRDEALWVNHEEGVFELALG